MVGTRGKPDILDRIVVVFERLRVGRSSVVCPSWPRERARSVVLFAPLGLLAYLCLAYAALVVGAGAMQALIELAARVVASVPFGV